MTDISRLLLVIVKAGHRGRPMSTVEHSTGLKNRQGQVQTKNNREARLMLPGQRQGPLGPAHMGSVHAQASSARWSGTGPAAGRGTRAWLIALSLGIHLCSLKFVPYAYIT